MHDQDPAAPCEPALLRVRGDAGHDQGRGHAPVLGDDLLPELRERDRLSLAYADLLRTVPWHQFWTLTFRANRGGRTGGMHGEAADKAFRYFVSCINRELYGRTWHKRPHRGLQWARGQEFHRDGRLHFHAVASAPDGDLNTLMSRYDWHEFWYREFGRNRIEAPRSQADVAGYVSKYVTKDGEVDFSKNFGAWTPPPRFYLATPEQTHLVGCGTTNDHRRQEASPAPGRTPRGDQRHGP